MVGMPPCGVPADWRLRLRRVVGLCQPGRGDCTQEACRSVEPPPWGFGRVAAAPSGPGGSTAGWCSPRAARQSRRDIGSVGCMTAIVLRLARIPNGQFATRRSGIRWWRRRCGPNTPSAGPGRAARAAGSHVRPPHRGRLPAHRREEHLQVIGALCGLIAACRIDQEVAPAAYKRLIKTVRPQRRLPCCQPRSCSSTSTY